MRLALDDAPGVLSWHRVANDDDEHDRSDDLDRAAILARRRRFVALAISGLATAGCEGPKPHACLNVITPAPEVGGEPEPEPENSEPESSMTGPIVENPGAPLQTEDAEPDSKGQASPEPQPQVCLKVAPKPCLRKATPRPCLDFVD